MNFNHAMVWMPDLNSGVAFYEMIGLTLIVDARPRYVRLELPDGDATLSLHMGEGGGSKSAIYFECDVDKEFARLSSLGVQFAAAPTSQSWLWREAVVLDPGGNALVLYSAGENRRFPPWRVRGDFTSGSNQP